ncbi:MAG: hypothetical protein QOG67_3910 [Verrucomicrobiota bacterium]|jgi:hypothetical protein
MMINRHVAAPIVGGLLGDAICRLFLRVAYPV